jgi:tRNA(fMet)-specific endonuclease VapC
MVYLPDTNVWIVLLKERSSRIRQQFENRLPSDIAFCSVVKAELITGALGYGNPLERIQKLEKLWAPFRSVPFDDVAAEEYGRIRNHLQKTGRMIGPNDLMIAATAVVNNLTLVTSNQAEFSRVPGLRLETWA